MEGHWDVVVVGAGPGGYVAALRAARLGLRVVVVDQAAMPGGTCLHYGCIPSKCLLDDSLRFFEQHAGELADDSQLARLQNRKNEVMAGLAQGIVGLFKKAGVTWVQGRAQVPATGQVVVASADGTIREWTCQAILLAIGSRRQELPGLAVDGVRILDALHALHLNQVPASLAVIGGGAIGLEMGSLWQRLGSRVTLLEAASMILPGCEEGVSRHAMRILQKQGLTIRCGVTVGRVVSSAEGASVQVTAHGREEWLMVDKILVAVGRQPQLAGVEGLGLVLDGAGRIRVDERYQTSVPGIYAIGDVTPGPMLAHRAMAEGVRCAELLAGGTPPVLGVIPHVVYTHPEVAGMGLTEKQARAQGKTVKAGQAFFQANARARCGQQAEGMAKVIVDHDNHDLLGVHMVGPGVAELAAVAVAALDGGWDAHRLGRMIFPHPSLGETLKEACLAAVGEAIHG